MQRVLGLEPDLEAPVVGLVTRLAEAKGIGLVIEVLEDLVGEGVQLALLGSGDARYERSFRAAQERHPGWVSATLSFDPALARQVYAGADLFLMPSRTEACGLSQMIALRYGTVPIVRETGGLKDTVIDYDEETGEGNGFTFTDYKASQMLEAVMRAVRLYRSKAKWGILVTKAMECDNSWSKSALAYMEMYRELDAL